MAPRNGTHAIRFAALIGLTLLAGCGGHIRSSVTFEFQHGTERDAPTYRATTTDPDVIASVRAQLAMPLDLRNQHINGVVGLGEGDDNAPWNWHFEKDGWALADFSTEVCDGTPSYVAEHVEEWVEDVGRYCPWSAHALREI